MLQSRSSPSCYLRWLRCSSPAGPRRLPGLLARAATPAAALLALPLTMNWSVTEQSLVLQPASLFGGRVTPWIHLAPSLAHFGPTAEYLVAGGPVRLLGVACSLAIGLWFSRARRGLGLLIAVVALTLTFRCVFESVIAPYYVFPTVAFALVSLGAATWPRSLAAALVAVIGGLGQQLRSSQHLGVVADRGRAGPVGRDVLAATHLGRR